MVGRSPPAKKDIAGVGSSAHSVRGKVAKSQSEDRQERTGQGRGLVKDGERETGVCFCLRESPSESVAGPEARNPQGNAEDRQRTARGRRQEVDAGGTRQDVWG